MSLLAILPLWGLIGYLVFLLSLKQGVRREYLDSLPPTTAWGIAAITVIIWPVTIAAIARRWYKERGEPEPD